MTVPKWRVCLGSWLASRGIGAVPAGSRRGDALIVDSIRVSGSGDMSLQAMANRRVLQRAAKTQGSNGSSM